MDNYPLFHDPASPKHRLMERLERRLLSLVDVVFVSSNGLLQKCQVYHSCVNLVPNGVDFARFTQESAVALEKLAGFSPPIVGYVGSVADWIDLDLVANLACQNPNWTIAMIGPAHTDTSQHKEIPNLHFLGPVVYADVAAYLQQFDVCIMPFKVNDLTRDVNPVKMYEYLATGKPIVSTCLPEVAQFGDLCYLSHTPDEFEEHVRIALTEQHLDSAEWSERRARRIAAASANTWDARTQAVLQALREHITHHARDNQASQEWRRSACG